MIYIYIYIYVCACTLQHIYMHLFECSDVGVVFPYKKLPVPATPFSILFAFSPQQLKPQRSKYLLMRSAGEVVDKRSTAPTCPHHIKVDTYINIYIYINQKDKKSNPL